MNVLKQNELLEKPVKLAPGVDELGVAALLVVLQPQQLLATSILVRPVL